MNNPKRQALESQIDNAEKLNSSTAAARSAS
ncbi:hypothetical protein [Staphylococcus aureus]